MKKTMNNIKDSIDSGKKKVTEAAKKAKNKAFENPKTSLHIGLGVLAVFLLYKAINKASSSVDRLIEGDPNIDDEVEIRLGDLKVNTSQLSIGVSQAKIYAQQLLDAMNAKEPFWGTDEDAIKAVFQQINSEDFKLIFHEFGTKDYNGFNSPPTGFFSNLDSYEPRNLVYWLNNELSSSDEVYSLVQNTVWAAGFAF